MHGNFSIILVVTFYFLTWCDNFMCDNLLFYFFISRKSSKSDSVKPSRFPSRLRAQHAPTGSGTTSFVDLDEYSPDDTPSTTGEMDVDASPAGGSDATHDKTCSSPLLRNELIMHVLGETMVFQLLTR